MAPSNVCLEVPESPAQEGEIGSSVSNVLEVDAAAVSKVFISAPGKAAVAPTSSVHELLECPVCTNSMYPPIHQVCEKLLNYIEYICLYIHNYIAYTHIHICIIHYMHTNI